jgi:hypothetical protein
VRRFPRSGASSPVTKAREAGVGAAIHHIGPLFGEGLEEEDAAVMVSQWGCNNVVLGSWIMGVVS